MPPQVYAPRPAHIRWLLDSDPAIRWQVVRDLTGEPAAVIAAERARVATEGWGAQLLARQSPAGAWSGWPSSWRPDLPHADRRLIATLYTLCVLKDLGLDPASPQAAKMIGRIERRLVFPRLGNRPFLHGETEPCINGRILSLGAYFHEPNHALAGRLLSEQLPDGGWNCEAPPSRCSSFHTTICVLEGLLDYERAYRKTAAVTRARKRGEAYLLDRRLFRSLRTGDVIDKRWVRFAYPPFWHYDVLRGLDYLRDAGVPPDSRIREAIEIVIARRHQNGRWPLNLRHPEYIPVEMETRIGSASHWNTLRALRVLRWYTRELPLKPIPPRAVQNSVPEILAVDGAPLAPESVRMLEYVQTRSAELTAHAICERTRAAATELENLVGTISAAEARLRPIPGKWNIAEVLDHIAQTQIRAAEELRHLLAGRRPPLPPVYEALRSGAGEWAPWDLLVSELRAANQALLQVLETATDAESADPPTVRTVMVAPRKLDDGSSQPQLFFADLRWKEYALLQRLHLLDHRNQIKKLRQAA